MIPVAQAQALCLDGLASLDTETLPLRQTAGRTLAAAASATRAQPPFAASAMDGYAVDGSALMPGATFQVMGEAAAGHAWPGTLKTGEACRIFTGAPVPDGANHVVIQEDVIRTGDQITILDTLGNGPNIRPAGADFPADFSLGAGHKITAPDLALLAAMNVPQVTVHRRPTVAFIATGDELVMPGGSPGTDQIIASNIFALAAMVENAGAQAQILPIAADTTTALTQAFHWALTSDLVVTIGGASVGDHDLVADVAETVGITRSFHKIAMRPGKPLMLGHAGATPFLGLPGNPVSAIVCGHLFLLPMVRRMMGETEVLPTTTVARLACDLAANGPRAHYMRARNENGTVTPFARQDSALLSVLTQANCLMIRPPNDPARKAGANMQIIPI